MSMVHAWNQYARPSFKKGWANILRISMFLTSNLFISFSRMPFYGRSETYFWYTISCPLVHRGCPWKGAIEWKIFFFCAMCHSLIGYQSCRLASSRWEPHVISWLVCVASYAQVSCLYIVEFLRYPLHLQNFLLWRLEPCLEVSASIGFFHLYPSIFFFSRL